MHCYEREERRGEERLPNSEAGCINIYISMRIRRGKIITYDMHCSEREER